MNTRVFQPQTHRVLVCRRRLPAGDVDRVAGRAKRRDELAKRSVQIRRHAHQGQAVVDTGIRQQHTGSACAGDDDHVFALGRRQHGHAPRELEELAQAARADHASLLEHVFVDLVVAGQGTGVRTGRLGSGGCAPSLEHDDGLLLGDTAGDFGKRPAILEVFTVLRDHARVVVLLEEGQQIVFVQIRLVAQAHNGRHPHLGRTREADDGHADATGLRGQRGRALDVVGRAEGCAQVGVGVVEAVDVRAHQANVVLAPDGLDFGLSFVVAGFRKSRWNQHGTRNLLFTALDQGARHELGGDGKHGRVDDTGIVLDAGVCLVTQDLGGLGMDRNDLALVTAVDEVLHHRIADLSGLGRRADDGNGLGLHDAIHRRHDLLLRRAMPRRLGIKIDNDAHVGSRRPLGCHKHGVEVEFRDLGKIADQLAHRNDGPGHGLAVGRLGATNTLEHLGRLDAVEHRIGVVHAGRCHAERDVLEHLDQHPAQAEGHQLAKAAIGHCTDDDLLPTREHLLHLHTMDVGIGLVPLGVGQNGVVAGLDVGRAAQAHKHAPRFGLVQDVGRNDLEHDRVTHLVGMGTRLGGRLGHGLAGHRDAIGLTDQFAFGGRQRTAPAGLDGVKQLSNDFLVLAHGVCLFCVDVRLLDVSSRRTGEGPQMTRSAFRAAMRALS